MFFSGSGSEATTPWCAWCAATGTCSGQPERQVIISRTNAYHGSTMAGASLGGMSGMHAQGGLPIPGIVHIEQPYWLGPRPRGWAATSSASVAAGWLERRSSRSAEKVAAFIGEPVQGAGGVIIPPDTYWPEIQRIVRQVRHPARERRGDLRLRPHRALVRLRDAGHRPDLMTFAKGVDQRLRAAGRRDGRRARRQVLIEKGGEFAHGYTYSGHPVACAVALANLADPASSARRARARRRRPVSCRAFLRPCATTRWWVTPRPAADGGLLAGEPDKAKGTLFAVLEIGMVCRGHCFRNGLIMMRAVGDRMIIAPPLVITRAQIDEMRRAGSAAAST